MVRQRGRSGWNSRARMMPPEYCHSCSGEGVCAHAVGACAAMSSTARAPSHRHTRTPPGSILLLMPLLLMPLLVPETPRGARASSLRRTLCRARMRCFSGARPLPRVLQAREPRQQRLPAALPFIGATPPVRTEPAREFHLQLREDGKGTLPGGRAAQPAHDSQGICEHTRVLTRSLVDVLVQFVAGAHDLVRIHCRPLACVFAGQVIGSRPARL